MLLRSTFVRFTWSKIAPDRDASLRIASFRFAFLRSAFVRFAPVRSSLRRSRPEKSQPTSLAPGAGGTGWWCLRGRRRNRWRGGCGSGSRRCCECLLPLASGVAVGVPVGVAVGVLVGVAVLVAVGVLRRSCSKCRGCRRRGCHSGGVGRRRSYGRRAGSGRPDYSVGRRCGTWSRSRGGDRSFRWRRC